MRLLNFDLGTPCRAIELTGLGCRWDLHNCAEFVGLAQHENGKTVVLEWRAPLNAVNPWGDSTNSASGCRLIFWDKKTLILSLGNKVPTSEHMVLADISKVDPNERLYRHRDSWESDQIFHLLFEFQGGRTIEIGAESAELHRL